MGLSDGTSEVDTVVNAEAKGKEILIALMGPTGAGKSSFIANATKREGEGVGHDLNSCTSEIKVNKCEVEGSNVVLVDTPGFDDTKKTDLDILKLISDWLNNEYGTARPILSAILYFHRISDNRMAGTPLKNLRVFQKLCGKDAMSKVILVTTMWDEVDVEVGDERLKELKDSYWQKMIARGSMTFECNKDPRKSPMVLLQDIVRAVQHRKEEQESAGHDEEGEGEVQLQEEISDLKMDLQETAAGQQLYSRLEKLAQTRMETLRKIRADTKRADEKTAEDLWREYNEVKEQLESTLIQARELRMTIKQRVQQGLRIALKNLRWMDRQRHTSIPVGRIPRQPKKEVLDENTTLTRTLSDATPSGDTGRRPTLLKFVDHFTERFRKEATVGDSMEVIPSPHVVLKDPPPGSERFEGEGAKADLGEMITLQRAALHRMSQDDPGRQPVHAKLDDYLYERFGREGTMADLEEIIALRRAALERSPQPGQGRPLLNLAGRLREKFQKQGSVADIEGAIKLEHAALELCPPGHPDRPLCRDSLRNSVQMRNRNWCPSPDILNTSHDLKQAIKSIVLETLENCPSRFFHTTTGILCNRDAQLSHFVASPQYSQLLSSISALDDQLRDEQIRKVVSSFFQYVMLSHRWGSSEPLLRDVKGTNIYDLGGTDGLVKLQEFCLHTLSHGFMWAWTDTCCIDKDNNAELQEAIGSMFSWYRQSSLTLVYLSDVSDASSLVDSAWFKRGWTLQELLASRTVLFYTQSWSLCMNREVENHKTDPTILAELQKATGIAEGHLTNFCPDLHEARSRLQWASGRCTTRPEDVAYSLFGIFNLQLPVLYGESAERALGRLLAEIISRSGDISILDWVGEASTFNSYFPANLTPYQTLPCIPPSTPSNASRRDDLGPERVCTLYSSLAKLPHVRIVNQKLTLPSIVHWVTAVKLLHSSTNPSRYEYEIHASHLRPLKATLSVGLKTTSDTYGLVRPWHSKLLGAQADCDPDAPWKLVKQLERPFNALLLERLPRDEYKRIASDCEIVACVQDLDILASEVLTLEIV
ncbi:hypothetical protein EDC04DRAFT_998756 [Pisolithus marmoratus]|nr:hypothetical protein EDC04DRAFT_998756 [Pisolithus marmoratus]